MNTLKEWLAVVYLITIAITLWGFIVWRIVKLFKNPIISPIMNVRRDALPTYDNNNSNDDKGYDKPEYNRMSLTKLANLIKKPHEKIYGCNNQKYYYQWFRILGTHFLCIIGRVKNLCQPKKNDTPKERSTTA